MIPADATPPAQPPADHTARELRLENAVRVALARQYGSRNLYGCHAPLRPIPRDSGAQ